MTTYYIRKSGNDLYTGLSGSGAWLTIGKANSALQEGDTVYIGAGDYSSESVDPTNTGTSGNLIIYCGDKLGENTGDIGSVEAKDFNINKSYINIRGIDFEDPCSFGPTVHPIEVIIDACSMPSLAINYPNDTYVQNCIIGPSNDDVVPLDILNASDNNIYIYYNTIIGPSSFTNGNQLATKGVLSVLLNTGEVYAKNNIIVANCDMKLIWLDTYDTKNYVNYNRYYSSSYGTYFGRWWNGSIGDYQVESTFEDWKTNSGQDLNSSVGDPEFVPESYRRYHIYASSPCVGAATDVGVDHDYDYDSRNSDIGADEVIINTRQRTIISDANITGTIQELIVSNTNIVIKNIQQIIISDTTILAQIWQFLISDVWIKVVDIQNILISDANVYNIEQQLITSDAKIHPVTSSDSFSFARIPKVVSNFSLKTLDETKQVLYDVKLEHICDHNLPSGKFTLNTCPRCLGTGFYYDIKFSPLGDVLTVNEVEKLLQELVKITITSKGSNPFYPEYGSYVIDSVGALQTEGFRETKLKQSIIDAVLRLRYLQRDGIEKGYKFSLKELIDKIESIEIYEIAGDPTQLGFKVKVTNVEGSVAILQGSVLL